MRRRRILNMIKVFTAAAAIAASGSAYAHHSAARFDQAHPATLTGIVKEFKWSNPHCWLYLLVPTANGGDPQEWTLEGPPVNTLYRTGWTKETLEPGMKVKVLMNPAKGGGMEGALQRLLEVNGVPTKVGTEIPNQ
jgi:Family of unknown function (DUF6152)